MTVTPPLKWHGGKHYLAKHVVGMMTPHLHYVEPYFGGGQVLFLRDPADQRLWWPGPTSDKRKVDGVSELVNDLDGDLMNFYRVLKDPGLFARMQHLLDLTLASETEWESAQELLRGGGDPVQRAAALFTSVRLSRQALQKDFVNPVRTRLRGGRQDHVNGWRNAIAGLEEVHDRLCDVLVLCRPALDVIRKEDTPATLFYLDPPYVPETRAAPKAYAHEMSRDDHAEMLGVIRGVRGAVLLSGYRNDLYDSALSGWRREDFDLPNNAAGGSGKRRMTECVWSNRG
jgi:DNA adenine methylase